MIPIHDNGAAEREMNLFLKSQKVLEVFPNFNPSANGATWNICVKYVEAGLPLNKPGNTRVDYSEILPPAIFAIFSKLRVIRKQIATDEAIPAYAVFTDEELSGISNLPELSPAAILNVTGVGEKKLEKYGNRMIEMFNNFENDKTGRKPDSANS